MSDSQNSLFDTGDSMAPEIILLADLIHGQEADFFALLSAKEELSTKDGKPYFRVTFRDAGREVSFPIWGDTTWATVCREKWTVGEFFKLRAQYRETNYGPQLEIRKIRAVNEEDVAEGFDPAMCLPASRYDPQEMFDAMCDLVKQSVENQPLADFTLAMLEKHHEILLTLPAAKFNHHARASGYLEHVLSVSRTAAFLAEKYAELYPDMQPPLDKGLIVAGAVLHDIGKIRELETTPTGAEYTAAGSLIGHILQGRDMVRELAVEYPLDEETLLRLEHIIVSHQRLPEWGSPKPPMFPEALIIHYADDLDAKLEMMVAALADDATDGPLTSSRNALHQRIYRGSGVEEKD
ncbi:MAG: HD domain-containing protein [Planctomycetes bacterium]|nr:HD domain-containing protein [Planctomycetota bacterium]